MKTKLEHIKKILSIYNSTALGAVSSAINYKNDKTKVYIEAINGTCKKAESIEKEVNQVLALTEYDTEKGNRISENIKANISVINSICKLYFEGGLTNSAIKKDCKDNIDSFLSKMLELDENLCKKFLSNGYKRAIKYSKYSHISAFLESCK